MKKVLIVGAGISGMSISYYLRNKFKITILEKNDYLGGHAHTHKIIEDNKTQYFDSGFIVFNNINYPNFLKLLSDNNVKYEKSNMSFSVFNKNLNYEWSGKNIKTLLNLRNLFTIRYWKILYGIFKFSYIIYRKNKINQQIKISEFLSKNNFNNEFTNLYFYPMCSSIWSSNINDIKNYQTQFILDFFENHGLANILKKRPQWMTISNGSANYVKNISKSVGVDNYITNSEVIFVDQKNKKVRCQNNIEYSYDLLILCNHTNQISKILQNKTENQKILLDMVNYTKNKIIIHYDDKVMPKKKANWCSWNFCYDEDKLVLTYWMNLLQNLKIKKNIFVTLNTENIDKNKIIKTIYYDHPVFKYNKDYVQKQNDITSGENSVFFAGAWLGNGFHEDGVNSAINVFRKIS